MSIEQDEPREIEGITDDTPDEITDFVRMNDVSDKFVVMLKQRPEGGGVAQTLRSFTNYYPNVNTLGTEWGPGSYTLVFSWRAEGKSGKKETVTKDFKIELPERAWAHEHHRWLMERNKKYQEEKESVWKEEAAKAKIMGGPVTTPAPTSDLDSLKKMLEIARSLGVPIGQGVKAEPKEKEKKSFTEKMIDLAPAITAIGAIVGPIAVAIIQRPKPANDSTLTNTLVNHLITNKPQENDTMKQFVPFLMGTMKQMFDFKQSMEPEEKQSFVEKVFDKLAPMVPQVLALATQPRAQMESNPMVGMARNLGDVKAMKSDPELAHLGVQRLDEVYGFQQANDILAVFGMERPKDLEGNLEKFPSKGFRPDGQPEDIRDVKMPDEAPGTILNDEEEV
jgi:hypothetical protein